MEEVLQRLTGPGRNQLLSRGVNTYYRIWTDQRSTVVKFYGTTSQYRREHRALEALAGVSGLPVIFDQGLEGSVAWVQFLDAGRWSLASMPENTKAARRAGEILHDVHEARSELLSNLSGGMDQAWIASDYRSTLERVDRYRRRLRISHDVVQRALEADPPVASEPRASHAKPHPRKFVVADDGAVTLIDWVWSTLAPPEWDYSLAVWQMALDVGVGAADALAEGYGQRMTDEALAPWIVYHSGMWLLNEAESRDGPLDDLQPIVIQLANLV